MAAEESNLPAVLGEFGPGNLPVPMSGGGRGMDEIDDEVLRVPRTKLLQPTSEEVEDDDRSPGMVINSISNEVIPLPARIVPIVFTKTRIHWRDLKDGGGIICRSLDGKHCDADGELCREKPEGQFGPAPENEPPRCSEYLNFLSLVEGHAMPIAVSFSKTSAGVGRDLASTARYRGGDLFSFEYTLDTKKVQNEKGTFWVYTIEAGQRTPAEQFEVAEQWYEVLRGKVVDIDVGEPDLDAEGAGDDPDWVKEK